MGIFWPWFNPGGHAPSHFTVKVLYYGLIYYRLIVRRPSARGPVSMTTQSFAPILNTLLARIPENFFSDQALPVALVIIMFGIGITLEVGDFRRVFARPRALLIGVGTQMLLVPALAFGLNALLPLSPVHQAGLVLISACPGGSASNLLTHMMKGRTALSVSMTSVNSLLVLFTLPLVTNLALNFYLDQEKMVELSFWQTFGKVFITVIIPVGGGMLVRYFFAELSEKLRPILRYVMPGLLLLVFAGVFFLEDSGVQEEGVFRKLLWAGLLFNLGCATLGFLLARLGGVKKDGQYTIAIEISLQNSAIAIFIASSLLEQPKVSLVAVVYSSFTFFSTALWAWLIRRYVP
jgi:bile acid:Na+ symporter, BASS family